jgi:hypothetical protein
MQNINEIARKETNSWLDSEDGVGVGVGLRGIGILSSEFPKTPQAQFWTELPKEDGDVNKVSARSCLQDSGIC